MRNCIFYSLVLALLFLIGSCKDSDDNKSTGATYDPNQPVTVESFMPVEGKLREKVIVKGSNFGTDKSKVKVYFVDDAAERLSTVIGIDNNTLYCLAPRQLPGGNRIKVIVDGKEVTTSMNRPRMFLPSLVRLQKMGMMMVTLHLQSSSTCGALLLWEIIRYLLIKEMILVSV